MNSNSKKTTTVSRGKFLTAFGSLLLIPFVSKAQLTQTTLESEDDDYQVLLKPDGSAVKVKRKQVENATTVKSKINNSTMFSWLKK